MTELSSAGSGFIRTGCAVLLALMALLRPILAVDTNAASNTESALNAQNSLRSFLEIHEQLRDTQSAIEKYRQEAQAAAASNTLALEDRLQLMEKTLAAERLEQLRSVEGWNRTILVAASLFAALGLLVLLLAVFLHWTAVQRLAAATASLSAAHSPALLGMGETSLSSHPSLEQSNARFLGLMERLERRIHQLEGSVKTPHSLPDGAANGESNGPVEQSSHTELSRSAVPSQAGTIDLLVSKSQTLMKLDKPEAALGCLDEVLILNPGHADALVKKGAVLERLQRFDEAVQCYDRAIAEDDSMTMAYLCKGGVFNRMERYSEALACYEQALKRSPKSTK